MVRVLSVEADKQEADQGSVSSDSQLVESSSDEAVESDDGKSSSPSKRKVVLEDSEDSDSDSESLPARKPGKRVPKVKYDATEELEVAQRKPAKKASKTGRSKVVKVKIEKI